MLDWIADKLLQVKITKMHPIDGDVLILHTNFPYDSARKVSNRLLKLIQKHNKSNITIVVLCRGDSLFNLPRQSAIRLVRRLTAHLTVKTMVGEPPQGAD